MEMAEDHLYGTCVDMVVISVAASSMISSTSKAATSAGIKVAKIIDFPTAAALACGVSPQHKTLVFDLTNSHLAVNILNGGKGSTEKLSDHDFTEVLVDYCRKEFFDNTGN